MYSSMTKMEPVAERDEAAGLGEHCVNPHWAQKINVS